MSFEPSDEVAWGANVTLRCKAVLSKPVALDLHFTIYKGNIVVCTQTMSSSADLLCPLTEVKHVNAATYTCVVKFEDVEKQGERKLTLKGVFASCRD